MLQPDGSQKPVDIRTLPFVRFDDNEVHTATACTASTSARASTASAPTPGTRSSSATLKIWDIHYAFRPQVPSLLVENLHIHRAAYGVYHPNYDHHVYRNVNISQTDTEPFNRGHDDLSVQYGV